MPGGFNQLVLRNCPNLKDLTFNSCQYMNLSWSQAKYYALDSVTVIRPNHSHKASIQSYFNKRHNIKQVMYATTNRLTSMGWVSLCLLENVDKIKEIRLTGSYDLFDCALVELIRSGFLKELNVDFEYFLGPNYPFIVFINSIAT